MAYAYDFNGLRGMVAGGTGAQAGKDPNAQIFGDQQATTNGSQPAADPTQNGQTTQGTQQTASTDAASLSGTGTPSAGSSGGSQTGGSAAPTQPTTTQTDAGNAVSRNLGRTTAPKALQGAENQIQGAGTSLQKEADTYLSGYQGKDYTQGIDNSSLDKAVTGDNNAAGAAQTRLASTQAPLVDAFTPTTNTDVNDAAMAKTDAGVQQLLRRDQDENYNAGEANFDDAVLNRDYGFNKLRSMVLGDQAALTQKKNTLTAAPGADGSLADQAQTVANKRYSDATAAAQTYLRGKSTGLTNDVSAAVAAENAKLAALRKNHLSSELGYRNNADAALAAANKGGALDGWTGVAAGGVDPNNYYHVGDDVTSADMTTADQAFRFDNIMKLLGQGGQSWVAGKGAGPEDTFDAQGYKSAVAAKAQELAGNAAKAKADKAAADAAYQAAQQKEIADWNASHVTAPTPQPITPPGPPNHEAPGSEQTKGEGPLVPLSASQQIVAGAKKTSPGALSHAVSKKVKMG